MANLIARYMGLLMIAVFLGYYAVRLGSVPVWIIILSVLIMASIDVIQSGRQTGNNDA